jgi:hypothetical protein
MQTFKIRSILWIGSLVFLLVGCTPVMGQGQTSITSLYTLLSVSQMVGQTFTASQGGLASLNLYLAPSQPGTGRILLHMRSSVNSKTDLAVASLPISQVAQPGYYNFAFSPQSNSYLNDYYFDLEVVGSGAVKVGSAGGDTYLDGSLYINDRPTDAQIAFQSFFSMKLASLSIGKQSLEWLGQLILAILLFIIPGWAMLSGIWPEWASRNLGEKTGLAAGVSVAIYPILFLWTDLVGLHLGLLYAWIPALLGCAFVAWKNRHMVSGLINKIRQRTPLKSWVQLSPQSFFPDFGLILITLMIVAVRLWVSRTLVIPLWGDSYQHTLMAQLLVDHQGLFNSWLPYTDLQTFTYHFGFHASVAVYHWLSGMDVPGATIMVGQWFNILAVLALYPLAYRITRQRWVGTAAVLVAGLLLSIPMVYINWGRYTQLAGQLVMPAAIYLAWNALDQPRLSWRSMALAGIAMSGLALTHYRIVIFAACFFPAWFIINCKRANFRGITTRLATLTVIAFGLFLPWFIHVYGGKLMQLFTKQISVSAQPGGGQEINLMGDLFGFLPPTTWLLLALCLAWGLWRKEKTILIFGIWWVLVALVVNPQWLHLPGAGALTNFALAIAVYIPAGILIGAALGWLIGHDGWLQIPLFHLMVLFLVIGAGVWGSRLRLRDIAISSGAMVTRPDLRAMAWIQANTPQNSRFLVNSFLANSNSAVVGSDAGWWLPLLAHRPTSLPPLTYVAEIGPRPDYITWVNHLTVELQQTGLDKPEGFTLLREYGIDYVYIGQRQGRVNYSGLQILDPNLLTSDPHYKEVYHFDRVWIFKVVP